MNPKHILPVKQHLRGEVPKGEGLVPDSVLQDKEQGSNTVLCMQCRKPLFKIHFRLNAKGQLMSTWTEMLGGTEMSTDLKKNIHCPHCKGPYFDLKKTGRPRFLTTKGIL